MNAANLFHGSCYGARPKQEKSATVFLGFLHAGCPSERVLCTMHNLKEEDCVAIKKNRKAAPEGAVNPRKWTSGP